MKHFYLLLLITVSHFTFAQDAALFDVKWKLKNLIIDGKDNFPPTNSEVTNVLLEFNKEQNSLNTNVCNEAWSENISFSTIKNEFTINNFAITLIICNNETNANFEQLYFPFFSKNTAPDIFSYTISELNAVKTLTITTNTEKAIYTNQKLATQTFKKSLINVNPNPAKDFINISFKNEFSNVAKMNLYDCLGKLCISQNLDSQNKTINIQNLKKGFYFLQIETQDSFETHKIIIK